MQTTSASMNSGEHLTVTSNLCAIAVPDRCMCLYGIGKHYRNIWNTAGNSPLHRNLDTLRNTPENTSQKQKNVTDRNIYSAEFPEGSTTTWELIACIHLSISEGHSAQSVNPFRRPVINMNRLN